MIVQDKNIHTIALNLFPSAKMVELVPIYGGRNNRAYHLRVDGREYFLKHYNTRADQSRSRLQAEYEFLSYAVQCECSYVAQPVVYDEASSIGVYEYIQGARYQKGELKADGIEHALAFLRNINQKRFDAPLPMLSSASEACFSVVEHLQRINLRVECLKTIEINDQVDQQAVNLVAQDLMPAWRDLRAKLLTEFKQNHGDLDAPLLIAERIISPSDFGFHNALKLQDGRVKFVDFEYSGWDDPAKLIGDFFSQVEVPVDLEYFDSFVEQVAQLVENKTQLWQRARLLLPAYRIKWCCIVLNYFLPAGRVSKSFAAEVTHNAKLEQLHKAKNILNSLDLIQE